MDDQHPDFGLTLRSGPPPTPATGAWANLAHVARHPDDTVANADELARAINSSAHAYQIGHRIYAVIKHAVEESPATADLAHREHDRASRLIVGLKPDVLTTAIASQPDFGDRMRTLSGAVNIVTPAAVRALALAAAPAYQQPASAVLTGLLRKLEMEVATFNDAARTQADTAFRNLVHQLIRAWSSANVETTASAYDHMFQDQDELDPDTDVTPEPERVVSLALETGAVGSVLWTAVAALSEGEDLRRLIGMLKDAPKDSRAAEMIAQQFANPQRLTQLLREDPVDFEVVDALLQPMKLAAGETLLNELIRSNQRAVRRGIIERVATLGPGLEPMIIERLKDERWFVLRNMLHVMNESGSPTTRVPVAEYQTHADPRVRREAMQLQFKDPIARDRALATAFKESDPALLRVALKAARGGLPDAAVPILAKRILESDFPPEFRIPAIQLLGRSKSLLALDSVLKYVSGGTTMLGKPKLAAKTPEMVAALKGLSRTWSNERRAKVLLELALASNDPNIVAAAQATSEPSKDVDDDGIE
ncbi:MAG: hypothetical protein WEE89_14055 [Gemmatimonadota bacterium]